MSAVSVASRIGLATILLFSLITIAFAGAPALPCEFYGKVTINGAPAPVGTIVIAKVGEQERGQFVLEQEGVYGGAGTFDKRLKVVAEDSDLTAGTPKITFWIDGQKAWQESSFQPGVSLSLDISVGGEQPAATPNVTPSPVQSAIPTEGPTPVPTSEAVVEPVSQPVLVPTPVETMPPATTTQIPVVTPTSNGRTNKTEASDALNADFTSDIQSGTQPLTVKFTDISTGNPTMWSWDFGDGASDIVSSPVHTYEESGTYTVVLTISNQDGTTDSEIKVNYITVSEPGKIVADFNGNPTSGNSPLSVYFTDASVGKPTSWTWDFGDGQTDNKQNTVHVYNQPGLFTVSLTVMDANGTKSSKQKEAYISVLTPGELIADYAAEPTSGVVPLSVKFTDKSQGGPTLWSWDFGDGSSDIVASPTHVYEKPGNYTVTLTISSQDGGIATKVRKEFIKAKAEPTPVPTLTVLPIPQVPETFFGTVKLYDLPITSGGTVEARVPGYDISNQFNPIKTAKGIFGKTGTFSPKMQVQGIPVGTEIEFWVADVDNSQTRAYIEDVDGSLLWSLPYEPGKEREVHLVVTGHQPTVIPAIPITPMPTGCPGVPSMPMTFSGDVHITDGSEYLEDNSSCVNCASNAQIGTAIEARIEGYDVSGPSNPITMASAGFFGGGNSSWTDKLSVQGRCVPEGSKITFWVTAPNWQVPGQAYVKDGSNYSWDIPYEATTDQESLNLWVGPIPTVKPTVTPTPTPQAWSPQQFYGKAEFNGYPLRVGDRVMATTEGVDLNSPTNPLSVVNLGSYGDPAGDELLTVEVPYTAMNQSDPISFWIKPQGFEYWYKAWVKNPLSSDIWKKSYPFTPGSITNLDIKSSDREEFMYFYDIVTAIKNVILPDDYTGW